MNSLAEMRNPVTVVLKSDETSAHKETDKCLPVMHKELSFRKWLTNLHSIVTGGGNRCKMGPVNADKPGVTETLRPRAKTDRKESS